MDNIDISVVGKDRKYWQLSKAELQPFVDEATRDRPAAMDVDDEDEEQGDRRLSVPGGGAA